MGTSGHGPTGDKSDLAGREPLSGRPGRPGLSRVVESFVSAYSGLSYVYMTQPNMRIHVLMASLAGAACIVAGVGYTDVLMIVLAIAGVMVAEVVNTVAESLTDLLEPQLNPIAKVIKDVAAAAVLIAAVFSIVIAVLVFLPTLPDVGVRLASFLDYRLKYLGIYVVLVVVPALAGFTLPLRPAIGRK